MTIHCTIGDSGLRSTRSIIPHCYLWSPYFQKAKNLEIIHIYYFRAWRHVQSEPYVTYILFTELLPL